MKEKTLEMFCYRCGKFVEAEVYSDKEFGICPECGEKLYFEEEK